MVDLYTSVNLPPNVGLESGSSHSSGVGKLKALTHEDFGTSPSKEYTQSFAGAFYGDGPYSLEHPNNTTEFVAQNVDYLA